MTAMIGGALSHHRMTEKLGEGGMGVVCNARDIHPERFVATKILPPGRIAGPDHKRCFVQDAKAASALNHPKIIHVCDVDQAVGTDLIARECVAGKTSDEPIPCTGLRVRETLEITVQLTNALAGARTAGIIQRDLKPCNVMPTPDDKVGIPDFAPARAFHDQKSEADWIYSRMVIK